MIRYTTPSHTLVVEGQDITAHNVYVTYKQLSPDDVDTDYPDGIYHGGGAVHETIITVQPITKTLSGNDTVLTTYLTQAQTAKFKPGVVRVQVNWKTSGGIRHATDVVKLPSFDNLYEEEI